MSITLPKPSEDLKGHSPDCSDSVEMMDLKLKIAEELDTGKIEGTPTISKFSSTGCNSRKKWKCKTLKTVAFAISAVLLIFGVLFLLDTFLPGGKPPGDELEHVTVKVFSEETTPSIENFLVSKTSSNVNTAEPTMPTKQDGSMLSIAKMGFV